MAICHTPASAPYPRRLPSLLSLVNLSQHSNIATRKQEDARRSRELRSGPVQRLSIIAFSPLFKPDMPAAPPLPNRSCRLLPG